MNLLRLWMALFVCCALFALTACGGGGGSEDEDDDDSDDNGSSSDSPRPTRTPRPTATPDSDEAPVFAPGGWTAGEAQATVSGGASGTLTVTLLARSSSTTGEPARQTTRLTYTAGLDTLNLSISREYQPFAMSFSKRPIYIQSDEPCEVTYTAKEEKRIEGSFRCTGVRVEQGGDDTVPTTVEGTFFATR